MGWLMMPDSLYARHSEKSLNYTKIFGIILNILIVLASGLIVLVIWSGGFKGHIMGHRISLTSILNPLYLLVVLLLFRFFLSIGKKNALTFAGSLLVAVSLLEISLRILDPPMALPVLKQIVEPSPVLGYRLSPLLRDRVIRTNSQGLRDREHSPVKPQGTKRILGIGDSFTFGYRVNLEECYLKQLERRLKAGSQRWDVINAGVTGYNMWQYLAYFKHYGCRYEPDLVTIGLFFDDYNGDPADAVKGSWNVSYPAFSFLRIVNFSRNCVDLLQYRYRHLFGARWLNSAEGRRKHLQGTQDYLLLTGKADPEKYNKLERSLKEFSALAKSHGSEVLVVLIPDVIQLKHPEVQVLNRIGRDICGRANVDFLDITPVFEKVPDIRSLYLLPYDAHISPQGHQIIAEELDVKIRMLLSRNAG